jgi:hypothetical protein
VTPTPIKFDQDAQDVFSMFDYTSHLAEHLANVGVKKVVLRLLSLPLALQARLTDPEALAGEIREAQQVRDVSGVPFWEALLLAAARSGNPSQDIVQGAGFHQPGSAALDEWSVEVRDLPTAVFDANARSKSDTILTLLSNVECTDGTWRHLPLLDFRAPANPITEPLVQKVASSLGGGLLTRSGSSYHLYGNYLVDESELHSWLGYAAQFNPITDGRWIAHQHRERCCALRISSRSKDSFSLVGYIADHQIHTRSQ